MHSRRPSPATVIAGVALFLALGGTAAAAHHFLITSTRQIKPSVLRALHGATGKTGIQGPAGPAGAIGAQGPQGPAGPVNMGALTIVRAPDILVPKAQFGTSIASCPAGSHVVSGGGYTGLALHEGSEMSADHQSWIVIVFNNATIETHLEAIAYCASSGQALAASAPGVAHARALRQADALVARLQREVRSR
jgi:hypothetical protein